MQECTLNITNSSMKPLKRIAIELLNKDKKLIDIIKTDENGNIFYDGETIDYFSMLHKDTVTNQEYREMKEVPLFTTYTHYPLTKLNENRYVVLPRYKKEKILNIVCAWYSKDGKKVGEATSNETSDCNMFITTDKAQPTYFTLTTKKGEKKKFKDADSRKNLPKDFVLKPNIAFEMNMIPV